MTRTVNLYVSDATATGTNGALAWTSTIKGKITAILWRFTGTQGGAASLSQAELSPTPIFSGETNDAQNIVTGAAVAFNAGGAGNPVAFNQLHNGFAFEVNVGDRLYINTKNSAAPTTAKWGILLTIQT